MNPRAFRPISLALVFALSSAAIAQTPSAAPAPLGESLHGGAKTAYEQGRMLFGAGDFTGALVKFKRGYELSHDPRLLFNMAVCEKSLRHYHRVQVLLQQYLAEAGPALTPESRASVQQTLDAIRGFVGLVKINTTPGAIVRIDGEKEATTPAQAPVPVDLGTHTVRVEKQGFRPFEKTIEVSGGGEIVIDAALSAEDRTAGLTILADNRGAIAIDGRVVGAERWNGRIPAGSHRIHVTAPDRKPYDLAVDLTSGESRTVNVVLEREGTRWPWFVAGGTAVAIGLGVGAYFLFKPKDQTEASTPGTLGTVPLALHFR